MKVLLSGGFCVTSVLVINSTYDKLLTLLLPFLLYKYRRNDTVRSLTAALTSARIQSVAAWSRLSFTSVHILLGSLPKRSNNGSAQVQQGDLLPGEHLPVPGSPVHPQQLLVGWSADGSP